MPDLDDREIRVFQGFAHVGSKRGDVGKMCMRSDRILDSSQIHWLMDFLAVDDQRQRPSAGGGLEAVPRAAKDLVHKRANLLECRRNVLSKIG